MVVVVVADVFVGAVGAVALLLVVGLCCLASSSTVFCNLMCASNKLTSVSLGEMAAFAEW